MLHKHDESLISAGHRVEFWKLLTPNRAWVHLSDRERRTKRVSEKEPSQSLSFLAPISSLNFFFFFLFKRLKGAQKAGPRKSAVFLLLARRDGLKGHPPSRTPPLFFWSSLQISHCLWHGRKSCCKLPLAPTIYCSKTNKNVNP